jgi:hypothetical protein
MMFRTQASSVLAISQPAHAWLSGQMLRAWATPLAEPLLLAAELHDIAWLEWERAPSFNPATGRPHSFRELGPAIHSPLWQAGVERALVGWGQHVALLVSRHGAMLYTRFADPARMAPEDRAALEASLRHQRPLQARWAEALGLEDAQLEQESGLIALVDALSLALCGDLKVPLEISAPDGRTLRLEAQREDVFTLSPWPFRQGPLLLEAEAIPLPQEGRFETEAAMRAWHQDTARVRFLVRLEEGS